MRSIQSWAAVAFVGVAAVLTGCGSSTVGTPVAAQSVATAADASRDVRIQFQGPWFKESQLCIFDGAQSVEDGPFTDGQSMTLEDETGALLARGTVTRVGKVNEDTCAMDAVFNDVPEGSANYVVVSTIGDKWRLLASEMNAEPVVIDFLADR